MAVQRLALRGRARSTTLKTAVVRICMLDQHLRLLSTCPGSPMSWVMALSALATYLQLVHDLEVDRVQVSQRHILQCVLERI